MPEALGIRLGACGSRFAGLGSAADCWCRGRGRGKSITPREPQIDGGGTAEARATIAEQLAKMPHHSVHLGHNLQANAPFLDRLLRQ